MHHESSNAGMRTTFGFYFCANSKILKMRIIIYKTVSSCNMNFESSQRGGTVPLQKGFYMIEILLHIFKSVSVSPKKVSTLLSPSSVVFK